MNYHLAAGRPGEEGEGTAALVEQETRSFARLRKKQQLRGKKQQPQPSVNATTAKPGHARR